MEEAFSKLSVTGKKDSPKAAKEEKGAAKAEATKKSNTIKMISWNLMGDELDDPDRKPRMEAAAKILNAEMPDAAFLQSLNLDSIAIIKKVLKDKYHFLQQDDVHTTKDSHRLILLLKDTITSSAIKDGHEVLPMPKCENHNDAIKLKLNALEVPIVLIAVHIRSKKDFQDVRMRQHRKMFEFMQDEKDAIVIGGGTTNTRDYEFQKLRTPITPRGIVDVYHAAGSPISEENTWDMALNPTRRPTPGRRVHAFRFERFYLQNPQKGPKLKVKDFKLIGKGKLDCGKLPSDHFGILASFEKMA